MLISPSVDLFLGASLLVVPAAYLLCKRIQTNSQSPYRNALTLLVLVHTVYLLYVITVLWPPNIFVRLGISINAPTEQIRSALLRRREDNVDTLPKPLQTLLTRLSSLDVRNVYIRFGQSVVQDCEHCRTPNHYALYAIPGPLLEYIREAAVIGLLTVADSYRSRWRTHGIVALVCACLAEAYIVATAQISIPRNGKGVFWYHDTFWLLRQLLFLLLPIVIHSLPATLPLNPLASMRQLNGTMEVLSRRTALLRLLHATTMREPSLRAAADIWWSKQKTEGQWVRQDDHVQRTAEKLGLGFVQEGDAGKLAQSARLSAEALLDMITIPPTHPT